jgi:hypothetical protein
MKDLLTKLISLLGKPANAPEFLCFLRDVGDKFEIVVEKKSNRLYSWKMNGLAIHVDKRQDQVKRIYFYLHGSREIGALNKRGYSGKLPAGVKKTDTLAQVKDRLASNNEFLQVLIEDDETDCSSLVAITEQELCYRFHFDRRERMNIVSVRWTRDKRVEPEPSLPELDALQYSTELSEVILFAEWEARNFKYHFLGGESLLLGLLASKGNLAADTLEAAGITLEQAREMALDIIGTGSHVNVPKLVLTPRADRIMRTAVREAMEQRQEAVKPEHVLLALIEEDSGVAAQVFDLLEVNLPALRKALLAEYIGGS